MTVRVYIIAVAFAIGVLVYARVTGRRCVAELFGGTCCHEVCQ